MTTGTCTACARTYTLRIGGTIRAHGRPRCPGSNQAPVAGAPEVAAAVESWSWHQDTDPGQVVWPALAEVGDSITSILDEHFPEASWSVGPDPELAFPIGHVVKEMAQEHNDLLRMADYRTLAAWAAGKRDEIQAMAEERAVRNARYDRALEQWVAEARDMLAAAKP